MLEPPVRVVSCRREPQLRALAVDRIAGEWHAVLPADEAADAAERRLDHSQIVARPDAMEQALVVGRHELAGAL
jgi:hypothetical protein